MQPKFQVGEVIRFADNEETRKHNMDGRLATITSIDQENSFYPYYFVAYGPTVAWEEEDLLPVNGGLKSANESVFDSIATLSLNELRSLRTEVVNAIEAHNQAIRKRRIQLLHEAISALNACMTDTDLADATFYFSDADLRAYSIADMSGVLAAELDAIVNECDPAAS